MKTICLNVLLFVVLFCGSTPARADTWSGFVSVTYITSDVDGAAYISTYPTISLNSSCSGTTLYLQQSNTPLPSYTTAIPFLLSALLYNKEVSFRISSTACGTAAEGYDQLINGFEIQQ